MPSIPASWKKNVSLECPNPQSMLHGPKPRRFQSQNFVGPIFRYGRVGTRVARESARPGDELVRRAGRVMGADRMVEKRLVLVLEELLIVLDADPPREVVVVVGREADQREDLAGLGVHDDDDPALQSRFLHAPLERLLRELLLSSVDRQPQGVPSLGLADRVEDLKLSTGRVLLDGLEAVGATKVVFVKRLESGLPDQIVRQVSVVLEILELRPGDGPGIPDHL
jgi:hypothetical protein